MPSHHRVACSDVDRHRQYHQGEKKAHEGEVWHRVCGRMIDMMDVGCGNNLPNVGNWQFHSRRNEIVPVCVWVWVGVRNSDSGGEKHRARRCSCVCVGLLPLRMYGEGGTGCPSPSFKHALLHSTSSLCNFFNAP